MTQKEKIFISLLIIIITVFAVILLKGKNKLEKIQETIATENNETNEESNIEHNETSEHSHNDVNEDENITLTVIEDASYKKEMTETKQFGPLEISNITLYLKDGVSTLIGKVKNTSNEVTPEKRANLNFIDENRKEIVSMIAVFVELQPGGVTELNTNVDMDVTKAVDFTVTEDAASFINNLTSQ